MTAGRFSGIILAGGSSRRMGTDKALLPHPADPSRTFLAHLVTVLDSCCSEVLVVVRDRSQAALYAHSLRPGLPIVLDSIPGGGPLVGLYSGLQAISTPYAILTAVDMPFITPRLLAYILSHYQDDTLLVPRVNGYPQVTLAIYPRSMLPLIEDRIRQGRRDLRSLLDDTPVLYIEEAQLRAVDPSLRSFISINTPEELRRS